MIAALTAERDLGRIAAPADIGALAPTLIGTAHLLCADQEAGPPRREAVGSAVSAAVAADPPGPSQRAGLHYLVSAAYRARCSSVEPNSYSTTVSRLK
ncbi:hypothetical protein [Nocardia abscessus]|uniref:hypothetical protein n=1 Tax=Nocardia abscessus TaxID=120957 RepID=UPI0024575361|nr:hypothetical protein [Nocardia abscessus]